MTKKTAENTDVDQLEAEEAERERSTIPFPYADLNNAKRIPVAIHEKGGTSLSWQQLAAHLNVAVRGGGFRLMAAAAKTFGLVTYAGQGNIQITALGRRICDPQSEASARVEAFLTVPLYNKLFERLKDGPLPANDGLEAEMVRLGVAKKVTDRARQIFQRSAFQAGFFEYGQERLVLPVTAPTKPTTPTPGIKDEGGPSRGDGSDGGGRGPLLHGLLDELPAERTQWGIDERVAWVELAFAIFERVYGKTGQRIKIEVEKSSSAQ